MSLLLLFGGAVSAAVMCRAPLFAEPPPSAPFRNDGPVGNPTLLAPPTQVQSPFFVLPDGFKRAARPRDDGPRSNAVAPLGIGAAAPVGQAQVEGPRRSVLTRDDGPKLNALLPLGLGSTVAPAMTRAALEPHRWSAPWRDDGPKRGIAPLGIGQGAQASVPFTVLEAVRTRVPAPRTDGPTVSQALVYAVQLYSPWDGANEPRKAARPNRQDGPVTWLMPPLQVSASGTDSGAGVEATATMAIFAGADSGSGVDGVGTQAGASGADTGAGSEATATLAGASAADTGSGVEGASVDTSGGVTSKADADIGAGAEAAAIVASSTQGDTGSAMESSATTAALSSADSGPASESSSTLSSLSAGDSAGPIEGAAIFGALAAADSGSEASGASIVDVSATQIAGADAGSCQESTAVANLFGRRGPDHPRPGHQPRPVPGNRARPANRFTSRRPRQ